VNLADRAPVQPANHEEAIITLLVWNVTDRRFWEDRPSATAHGDTCHGCELGGNDKCPFLTNVRWLRDPETMRRLHELFELAHHMSGNVITFRDVLAVLARGIAGYADYYGASDPCDAVRAESVSTDMAGRLNLSRLLIYNSLFSDQDPYREYVSFAGDGGVESKRQHFFGYGGPYFVTEPEERGFMAALDPARSDNDALRVLDDEVFNFPDTLLRSPLSRLEESLFDAIRERLARPYAEQEADQPDRVQWQKEREWLLYCLTRLARRRSSLLASESFKDMTEYRHAGTFCKAVSVAAADTPIAARRQIAGDIVAALSAFSGRDAAGGVSVSYSNHDAEIPACLSFDVRVSVESRPVPSPYVEHYPRAILAAAQDPESGPATGILGVIEIDLTVWECLQRVAAGYDPAYTGVGRVAAVDSFLLGLRARAWRQRGAKLVVERGDVKLMIARDGDRLVIL
jgi:hypothetical protein